MPPFPLWQKLLWHQVAHATAIPSGIISLCRVTHVTPVGSRCGVKGHLGSFPFWVKILKKGNCIHIFLMYIHGTCTQLCLGSIAHVTPTGVGSKLI